MVKGFMRLMTHNLDPSHGKIKDEDTVNWRFQYGAFSNDAALWRDLKNWLRQNDYSWKIIPHPERTRRCTGYFTLEITKRIYLGQERRKCRLNTWIYEVSILYISPQKIQEELDKKDPQFRYQQDKTFNAFHQTIYPILDFESAGPSGYDAMTKTKG